jgi:hypothetical protein
MEFLLMDGFLKFFDGCDFGVEGLIELMEFFISLIVECVFLNLGGLFEAKQFSFELLEFSFELLELEFVGVEFVFGVGGLLQERDVLGMELFELLVFEEEGVVELEGLGLGLFEGVGEVPDELFLFGGLLFLDEEFFCFFL